MACAKDSGSKFTAGAESHVIQVLNVAVGADHSDTTHPPSTSERSERRLDGDCKHQLSSRSDGLRSKSHLSISPDVRPSVDRTSGTDNASYQTGGTRLLNLAKAGYPNQETGYQCWQDQSLEPGHWTSGFGNADYQSRGTLVLNLAETGYQNRETGYQCWQDQSPETGHVGQRSHHTGHRSRHTSHWSRHAGHQNKLSGFQSRCRIHLPQPITGVGSQSPSQSVSSGTSTSVSSENTDNLRRKRRRMKRHRFPDQSSQLLQAIKTLQLSHDAVQTTVTKITARLDMGQDNNEEVPCCLGQQRGQSFG